MDDRTEPIEAPSAEFVGQPSAAEIAQLVLDRPDAGSWGLLLIPVVATVALCITFFLM